MSVYQFRTAVTILMHLCLYVCVFHAIWCQPLQAEFRSATWFKSERWLDSDKSPSSPFAKDKADASQPFSLGPRSCISQKLAYFELRLILARMLFNFGIDLPDGPESSLVWTN